MKTHRTKWKCKLTWSVSPCYEKKIYWIIERNENLAKFYVVASNCFSYRFHSFLSLLSVRLLEISRSFSAHFFNFQILLWTFVWIKLTQPDSPHDQISSPNLAVCRYAIHSVAFDAYMSLVITIIDWIYLPIPPWFTAVLNVNHRLSKRAPSN